MQLSYFRWPLKYKHLPYYLQLIRFNRPIGTLLLLYPCLMALFIASEGTPSIKNFIIFSLGTLLMRSAGCAINDYADRHWDSKVTRTKERPLALNLITPAEAIWVALLLAIISFILVLFTNWQTIALSFVAVGLAALYPFTKRFTHWPQIFLGIAFAWSIPMSFTAENHPFNSTTWLLLLSTLLWTLAYDTLYAMVDRPDDIKAGIKSTAILFGRWDKLVVGILQVTVTVTLALIGLINQYTPPYFLGLLSIIALFSYQQFLINKREPQKCFRAFINNQWVGFSMLIGTIFTHII